MRIALLYPPPWKIAERDKPPYPPGEGPPRDYAEGDLDADFWQMPYGMMSLGAQAVRAGHQLRMLNLSAYSWPETEEVIARLDAELFGLSCWTANRRGVAMAADAIRRHHPNAHILVGGPHATPLAREMLEHYPAIDTGRDGESEPAFIELMRRLEAGASPAGIPGTLYRAAGRGARARAHGASERRYVHDESKARRRTLSGDPRAEPPFLLELRHACRHVER